LALPLPLLDPAILISVSSVSRCLCIDSIYGVLVQQCKGKVSVSFRVDYYDVFYAVGSQNLKLQQATKAVDQSDLEFFFTNRK
jgi:hypothetical protein